MIRPIALTAAIAAGLLAVSGAGGAPAQTPKRGGTVVIATAAFLEPACLNPLLDTCRPRPASLDPSRLVMGGAFEIGPGATFRPNLVSRVDIVSRKPFALHYRIRPEARWSDGVAVTANDFVFTDRAIRAHRPEREAFHWTHVRSVRARDPKTVRVVLSAPHADWRFLFERVLPRHALAEADLANLWRERVDDPKTGRPIGSGPFLVEGLERGKQLTLVRNPRYWGSHTAYLERLVWRFVPPEEAAAVLRRGEVGMIQPGPAVLQAAALELRRERAPGIRVESVLGEAWEHVEIRTGKGGHPALANPLVRQALAYGLDRVEIARAAGELSGARGAPRPLDSIVFLPNSPFYQPNWKGYRHQPALARRLLERAGCQRGRDDIYSCTGERLSLRLITVTGVASRERVAALSQARLRQVGIEVRPVFVPQAIFFGTTLPSGEFDLALFSWIVGGTSTSGLADVFGCQRPSNLSGYCSRLVSRDLDQATRIVLNDGRRERLLNNIDVRLAKAVPTIPLYQATGLFAFKTSIRGIVPNGAGEFTWNAENWWLAE